MKFARPKRIHGDGVLGWRQFGAWGDLTYDAALKGYYDWNAASGYMRFPAWMGFDTHDVLDEGMYYVLGRWYNPDSGLWLSPNEKGDYMYGGDGPCVEDPLNCGWATAQRQLR